MVKEKHYTRLGFAKEQPGPQLLKRSKPPSQRMAIDKVSVGVLCGTTILPLLPRCKLSLIQLVVGGDDWKHWQLVLKGVVTSLPLQESVRHLRVFHEEDMCQVLNTQIVGTGFWIGQ